MRPEVPSTPPLPTLPAPVPPSVFPSTQEKFSNPCTSKFTTQIIVARRPSSAQLLSMATLTHNFCKSYTGLSCLKLRKSRKAPTLNVWVIAMENWEAKYPHNLSYTSIPSYFPTPFVLGVSKTIVSISLVLCLPNSTVRLSDSYSNFPVFYQVFRASVNSER